LEQQNLLISAAMNRVPDWAKIANWATFGSRWLPEIWLWRLANFLATF